MCGGIVVVEESRYFVLSDSFCVRIGLSPLCDVIRLEEKDEPSVY